MNASLCSTFDPAAQIRIAELEAENAYLKSELGLSQEASRIDAVRRTLALSPGQAMLLLALYDTGGRVLSHGQIADAIGAQTEGSNLCAVVISRLHSIAGHGLVRSIRNHGYAITPAGAARVREALGG